MDWKTLLFGFKGRMNRARYWQALLAASGAMVVFMIILVAVLMALDPSDRTSILGLLPVLVLAVPMMALMTWSWAATSIKRLHDRGKSGWWMLLFFGTPILISKMAFNSHGSLAAQILEFSLFALGVWSFIELYCLRGTSGPNRFGPDSRIKAPPSLHDRLIAPRRAWPART
jgi:uncharacterized membrane protein YhaH (DUF805 family)